MEALLLFRRVETSLLIGRNLQSLSPVDMPMMKSRFFFFGTSVQVYKRYFSFGKSASRVKGRVPARMGRTKERGRREWVGRELLQKIGGSSEFQRTVFPTLLCR